MTADWRTFLDTALLFVVLVNPASKVALLAGIQVWFAELPGR